MHRIASISSIKERPKSLLKESHNHLNKTGKILIFFLKKPNTKFNYITYFKAPSKYRKVTILELRSLPFAKFVPFLKTSKMNVTTNSIGCYYNPISIHNHLADDRQNHSIKKPYQFPGQTEIRVPHAENGGSLTHFYVTIPKGRFFYQQSRQEVHIRLIFKAHDYSAEVIRVNVSCVEQVM